MIWQCHFLMLYLYIYNLFNFNKLMVKTMLLYFIQDLLLLDGIKIIMILEQEL